MSREGHSERDPSAIGHEQTSGWPPNSHRDLEHDPDKKETIDIYLISKLMSQTGLEFLQDVGKWGFRDTHGPPLKLPCELRADNQPSLQLNKEVETLPLRDPSIPKLAEEPKISLSSPLHCTWGGHCTTGSGQTPPDP